MADLGPTTRLRDSRDGGFTLVELLVSMTLALVIAATSLLLLDAAIPHADRELQREVAVGEARSGLERMVREIRNADRVNATSPTLIDINAPTASGARRIVYQCNAAFQAVTYRQCTRYSGAVGGAVSGGSVVVERLINGTTSQPVFTYLPDKFSPRVVQTQIVVPASGGPAPGYTHRVILRDAAYMRNVDRTGG